MSSVQKLVTDEDVFPTKYGTSLPCCTPPYWAAVAAYGKGPDLWDRDSCVTWTVKPGRCALAGVSLATPGSGTWSLCHPAPPPVPWGCCSPSHWGPDSQQAVATLHPDLAGGAPGQYRAHRGWHLAGGRYSYTLVPVLLCGPGHVEAQEHVSGKHMGPRGQVYTLGGQWQGHGPLDAEAASIDQQAPSSRGQAKGDRPLGCLPVGCSVGRPWQVGTLQASPADHLLPDGGCLGSEGLVDGAECGLTLWALSPGREFPSSFESLVKKICKYLFHVLAHIYWSHFKETLALELHGHLNTLYVHFILFAREFNLLDPKETAVMDDLTEVLCSGGGRGGGGGDGASGGGAGAQNHGKER